MLSIIDTSAEIVGSLLSRQFICVAYVEKEFADTMRAFWADNPIPLTAEEAMKKGYGGCDFLDHHKSVPLWEPQQSPNIRFLTLMHLVCENQVHCVQSKKGGRHGVVASSS